MGTTGKGLSLEPGESVPSKAWASSHAGCRHEPLRNKDEEEVQKTDVELIYVCWPDYLDESGGESEGDEVVLKKIRPAQPEKKRSL